MMRKILQRFAVALLCFVIAGGGIIGCVKPEPAAEPSVDSVKLRYNGADIANNALTVLMSDGPLTFTASVTKTGEISTAVTLTSSDTAVATVSGLGVTLVKPGTTTLTLKSNADATKTHAVTLTVNADRTPEIVSLVLKKGTTEIEDGDTLNANYTDRRLTLTSEVEEYGGLDVSVELTGSTVGSVATVDGMTIDIVDPGTTVITATASADGVDDLTMSFTLEVNDNKPVEPCFLFLGLTAGTAVIDNTNNEFIVALGENSVTFTDDTEIVGNFDYSISLSVDDTNIAAVDGSNNMKINLLDEGETEVTMTATTTDESVAVGDRTASMTFTLDVKETITVKLVNGSTSTVIGYEGQVKTISAATAPTGMAFLRWQVSEGDAALASASSMTASITFGEANAEAEAVYTYTAGLVNKKFYCDNDDISVFTMDGASEQKISSKNSDLSGSYASEEAQEDWFVGSNTKLDGAIGMIRVVPSDSAALNDGTKSFAGSNASNTVAFTLINTGDAAMAFWVRIRFVETNGATTEANNSNGHWVVIHPNSAKTFEIPYADPAAPTLPFSPIAINRIQLYPLTAASSGNSAPVKIKNIAFVSRDRAERILTDSAGRLTEGNLSAPLSACNTGFLVDHGAKPALDASVVHIFKISGFEFASSVTSIKFTVANINAANAASLRIVFGHGNLTTWNAIADPIDLVLPALSSKTITIECEPTLLLTGVRIYMNYENEVTTPTAGKVSFTGFATTPMPTPIPVP